MPLFGVYVAIATTPDGVRHPAVVNIGRRPTVEEDPEAAPVTIEAHIIDYAGYLYGSMLELDFISYLRPEKKFPSIDKLRQALENDKKKAKAKLEKEGYMTKG